MEYAVKWNDKGPSKQGPSADKWFEALRAEGWKGRLPIDEKPELNHNNADLWRAFWELNNSRKIGMTSGPIPYSEITYFLDEEEIIRIEDRVFYRRIINEIDRAYLNALNKAPKRQGKNDAKGNRNSRLHRHPKG